MRPLEPMDARAADEVSPAACAPELRACNGASGKAWSCGD